METNWRFRLTGDWSANYTPIFLQKTRKRTWRMPRHFLRTFSVTSIIVRTAVGSLWYPYSVICGRKSTEVMGVGERGDHFVLAFRKRGVELFIILRHSLPRQATVPEEGAHFTRM